jgi:hypothetical protein
MVRARGGAGFCEIRYRVGGVSQMSVKTAPGALSLVPLDAGRRDLVSHSFAFFTGLCEKDRAAARSLALLTGRHK